MNEKKLINEVFENHIIKKDEILLNAMNSKSNEHERKYLRIVASFLLILFLPISVYAVSMFLSPSEVSEFFNNEMLEEAFNSDSSTFIGETKTDNGYIVSFLGMTASENLRDFEKVNEDTFYFVVGIKREDNTPISADESFFISPIIHGLSPFEYSIMTMNGGYSKKALDGVLYMIIDMESVEIFAHRGLQLAVIDNTFYELGAFDMDSETGVFYENENYHGLNVLFDIPLDKSLGDEDAVLEYMDSLKEAESVENTIEYSGDVSTDWFSHIIMENLSFLDSFDEYGTTVSYIEIDFSDNLPQTISIDFRYKFEDDENYKTDKLYDYPLDKNYALDILNGVHTASSSGGGTYFSDDTEGRYVLEKRVYILEDNKVFLKTSVAGIVVYDYETYEYQTLILE